MRWLETSDNAFRWMIGLKADLLRAKSLGYLVWIAAAVTLAAGLALFVIDPSIRSPFDGIWYAWVTMTHVGYGDVVPTSVVGRLLAGLLILFGLVLFALFTATFSAALVGKGIGEVEREVIDVEEETSRIQKDESLILQELARLHQRLDQIEEKLSGGRQEHGVR